jgi:hypothetical protein
MVLITAQQRSYIMGRGSPVSGFRKTKQWYAHQGNALSTQKDVLKYLPNLHISRKEESDDTIDLKLRQRFEILDELTDSVIEGNCRSLIIAGPAGLGKSYSVEKKLAAWDKYQDNHIIVKGFVGLTGLYKVLYDYRQAGKVIVFDDADSIYTDMAALNLLKGACDSSDIRRLSYRKETKMVSDIDGAPLETDFVFEGSVIFITNEDFDAKIAAGHRLAPHFAALISRAHYIDLEMKTQRDYMVRINQVVKLGMLKDRGCNPEQETIVLNFVKKNKDLLRELSLRMVIKIADIVLSGKDNWERIAEITCCRNS